MNFFSKLFNRSEEILHEEYNEKGHKIPYLYRPAKKRNKPLLVVLHGNGNNKTPSRFVSPDYNVLLPLDRYGIKNNGCWFLGENGDFFFFNILKNLISRLRSSPHIGSDLFFWGSSMGGYASFLFSLLMDAQAAFCHIPQTNLHNSAWYKKNKVFIDKIFGEDDSKHPWRDLPSMVIKHTKNFPLFFLSFNRFDRPNYLDEHLWPLLRALDQKKCNYFLQIHPQKGHANHQSVATHVANFQIYAQEIKENKQK